MVEITQTQHFIERDTWRQWLEKNQDSSKELWLIFYKKHTKKPTLPYNDAVEEALCFGWIDGILKRLDEEKYVVRFSHRKKKSVWSESNRKRVAKMLAEGKMTTRGLALVAAGKESGEWDKALSREIPTVPPELEAALEGNPKARENFSTFTKSQKTQYLWWIDSAKREETRERRIREVVKRAEENRKPGIN